MGHERDKYITVPAARIKLSQQEFDFCRERYFATLRELLRDYISIDYDS